MCSAGTVRILIFSQISEQRDSEVVFERLATSLSPVPIHSVIFTQYDPTADFDSVPGKLTLFLVNLPTNFSVGAAPTFDDEPQKEFIETWKKHQIGRAHV